MKIILRATREECGECALLGNISPTAESLEYQPLRPVTEPMNGATFAHFSKTKFGPNLAALPSGLSEAFQRFDLIS